MDDSLPKQQKTSDDTTSQQNTSQVSYPVGSVAKEYGPISTQAFESKPEEYLTPSGAEAEPSIPSELAEHGVEAVPNQERPSLSDHHKQVGIQHAKETTPVATAPQGVVQLPPEAEVQHVLKTTKVSDSKHWLAALVEKVYEKLRLLQ